MKNIFVLLLISFFLISCSNKSLTPLTPLTPQEQSIIQAGTIYGYLLDDSKIEGIGVNYLYYFSYAVYALHMHGLLNQDLLDRYNDILNRVYKPSMRGFYSLPQDLSYPSIKDFDRTATRDDYSPLGLYIACKYYQHGKLCEHLKFMTDIMNDSEDPYIPEDLRQEDETSRIMIMGSFVNTLIKFYKNTVISGLELSNDVWSPYHRNCYRRAVSDYSGNQKFWDMGNFYFSKESYSNDSTSSKLLAMSCLFIARKENPTYWSNKADNYLHANTDMNDVITEYYLTNPNEFFQALGNLLLGIL